MIGDIHCTEFTGREQKWYEELSEKHLHSLKVCRNHMHLCVLCGTPVSNVDGSIVKGTPGGCPHIGKPEDPDNTRTVSFIMIYYIRNKGIISHSVAGSEKKKPVTVSSGSSTSTIYSDRSANGPPPSLGHQRDDESSGEGLSSSGSISGDDGGHIPVDKGKGKVAQPKIAPILSRHHLHLESSVTYLEPTMPPSSPNVTESSSTE